MTSIERTAYPQFRRLTSARVLHVFFTPAAEEIAWAQERTASPESLFALVLVLVLALKCFQKMARFCPLEEIPEAKLAEVEAKIADLQVIAATLRAAVDADCHDLAGCAGNPCCPIPFAPLAQQAPDPGAC